MCAVLSAGVAWGQTPIWTWHYDNAKSGANTTEVLLTPANVNVNGFGKLFTQPVDGFILGHPLYLPGVTIPGAGVHNVVYVATMNDTVYAFDANTANATALWTTSLLTYSAVGATPVPIAVKGCGSTVQWTQTGVISTPVIDQTSGTIYLVAETYEGGKVVHRLHALNVATGSELTGWPVTIAASGTQNGLPVTFVDTKQMNRPGLLLSNGNVYVGFGSDGCNGGDSGWIMSYNVSTAQLNGAFDIEPGNIFGSVWQKGAGLSADSSGNVYAETGEGGTVPGVDMASSIFKLTQGTGTLTLADWFTPWNYAYLDANDMDLNNAVVLLPDQSGPVIHEAVSLGKEGTIYVLNRDNMGQLCSNCNGADPQIVQELPGVAVLGYSPVVWNGAVYITGSSKIEIYSLNNGQLVPGKSVILGSITHPIITANGTSNGIVWLINGANLVALNATNLNKLYASNQAKDGRDILPALAHFASPVAADGEVFIGTQDSLVVYGLFPPLNIVQGNQQSATVESTLPVALQVQAINSNTGASVPGLTVTFSDGGKGGTFSNPTGVTDVNGLVSTSYTFPKKSGTYTVTATGSNFLPTIFTETALPASPAALSDVSGQKQTTPAGTALANPIVVKVRDTYSNGVPGIAVSFSDKGAGGTLSGNPVTTNNLGEATVAYTAGTKAENVKIYASTAGLPSIVVAETVEAGPAQTIAVVSGNGQSAPVSTLLAQPLVVEITDQYGNPVSGATVQFSDGGAGGSFAALTVVTDASGNASGVYTTPAIEGEITVQATVGGVSGAAVFSVDCD
jgi:hypothetical protein